MERKYYLMASPDLLGVNYDLLADESMDSTRYSVNGQWAIVEFKEEPVGLPFTVWTNAEACDYLEANFDEWNAPSVGPEYS